MKNEFLKSNKNAILVGAVTALISQALISTISIMIKVLLEVNINFWALIIINILIYNFLLFTTLITISISMKTIYFYKERKFRDKVKFVLNSQLNEFPYRDIEEIEQIYQFTCIYKNIKQSNLICSRNILRELNIDFIEEEIQVNPYVEYTDAVSLNLKIKKNLENIFFVELNKVKENALPF